jgi:hypothetical protein
MVTYCARPLAQVAELSQELKNVRALSLATGDELKSRQELEACDDPWVYYMCEIP